MIFSAKRLLRTIRSRLYPVPVLTRNYIRRAAQSVPPELSCGSVCLDVGAGAGPYRHDIVSCYGVKNYFSCDIMPSETTHVVADIRALPFADASVSHVFAMSILQHVPNPALAFDEIARVIKPGGVFVASFPFLFGECEIMDCNRWTLKGMEDELVRREFDIVDIRRSGGIFFAWACGLHLLVQLIIPGGRGSWRRQSTALSLIRNAVVVALTIPTAALGWIALLLDRLLPIPTLNGFYQGGLVLARKR